MTNEEYYAIKKGLEETGTVYKATQKTVYEYAEKLETELDNIRIFDIDELTQEDKNLREDLLRAEESSLRGLMDAYMSACSGQYSQIGDIFFPRRRRR